MKPSHVALAIQAAALLDIPLFLWGAPGVGKSSSVMQAASALDGRYGLLFLDELTGAPQQVQGALYQLCLDRRVGSYEVPRGWRIVAAGNRRDDRGVFHRMPDPLIDRFIHVEYEPDMQDWSVWALQSREQRAPVPGNLVDYRAGLRDSVDIMGLPGVVDGRTVYAQPAGLPVESVGDDDAPAAEPVRPEVVAFIRFRPGLLHSHDPARKCTAFATPRGWADVSRILGLPNQFREIESELIRGRVGDGAASEFMAFLKLYRSMISPDAIMANPTAAEVPTNVGTLYALAEALARRANVKNIDRVLTYARRMPTEYSAALVASMIRISPELAATADYTRYCIDQGNGAS